MAHAVDVRSRLPGARDQGPRPTCLAFAMSDAHTLAAGHSDLLSADYLHFHAAKRAGVTPNKGVGFTTMRDALRLDGQPLESACPYSASRNEKWAPPADISPVWTRDSSASLGKPSELLVSSLAAARAPVLVFRVSRSFFLPDPSSHVVADDHGADRRFHAVVIVGMRRTDADAAFLARNSWGTGWGLEGHAWLPAAYVDARATKVITLEVRGGVR